MLKTVKAILNICLARRVVVVLLICGTLITSTAATGQTFATTKEQPDIGTDDGITIEGGAEDEEATDEDDNQTTAKLGEGFCLEGTGGDTGRKCIPCDPGLKIGNCINVLTGEPLDMDTATSESGKDKGKGQFVTPEIAQMLQSTDTADRPKIIFDNLVEQLSSGDIEESTKALDTLCIMVSGDNSSKIDCSKPIECGPLCGAALGWLVGKVADQLSKKEGAPTGCHTYLPPIYCKLE